VSIRFAVYTAMQRDPGETKGTNVRVIEYNASGFISAEHIIDASPHAVTGKNVPPLIPITPSILLMAFVI